MLSVIVNFYNNRREAKNTLHSLTRAYQKNIQDIPYEVIALDNGSTLPLSEAYVRAYGPEFRYQFVATNSQSPVTAMNNACREAAGDVVIVIIDGAHILSPGILQRTHEAFRLFQAPFVATVPFHLGPKKQNRSVQEGYNPEIEDALLRSAGWWTDGYRLFNVTGSYADGSQGWFGCLYESGCVGMRKRDYLALGGFDERFQSRGGGLTNLDFFQRALESKDLEYVMLLGEGTFHQVHGGVASNAPPENHPWSEFHREYEQIRGRAFERVLRQPFLMGSLPQVRSAQRIVNDSANLGWQFWEKIVPE